MTILGRSFLIAGLAGGLLLAAASTPTQASFVPVFVPDPVTGGATPGPGAQFTYRFNLSFTTALDPNAGTSVERLEAGDFLTIYNLAGYVPGSATVPGGGFTITEQFIGINGFEQTAAFNNPTLLNVTFIYNGPTLFADRSFNGVTIRSTVGPGIATGRFTFETTKNTDPFINTPIGGTGFVAVPIPEPISMALLGIGGAAAFGIFRRRSIAVKS
ncbi:hypothetical protein BH23PLA1_BH23PLA1_24960 [soil metagenome]